MTENQEPSPLSRYLAHCEAGELAYQYSMDDGYPVFYPRLLAPGSGSNRLEWRISRGCGVVYATTVIHRRDTPPYNVALIDVDEGFRMMSRVEGVPPDEVRVGMRVRVRMQSSEGDTRPYPVFVPNDAMP